MSDIPNRKVVYFEDHKVITTDGEYCYISLFIDKSVNRLRYFSPKIREKVYTDTYNETVQVLGKLSQLYDDVKIIETNNMDRTIVYRQHYYSRSLVKLYNPVMKPDILRFLKKSIHELRAHGLVHTDIALRNIMIDENDEMHLIDLDSIIEFETFDPKFAYIEHDLSMTTKEFRAAIGI
jgi:RIO-like serine/threonine protein kinase